MKKLHLILSSLLLLGGMFSFVACNKKPNATLQTVGLTGAAGEMVYITDATDPKTIVDSILVTDTLLTIDLTKLTQGHRYDVTSKVPDLNFSFVPESASLTYDVLNHAITGSPANDAAYKFRQDIMPLFERDSLDKPEGQRIIKAYLADQKNNPLVLEAFQAALYFFDQMTDLKGLLAEMGPQVQALPDYQKQMELISALETTAPGQPFMDFSGIKLDGTPVKLSDYVGQGMYVLVDFWASWCGPCRHEIPNLIKIYNQYKNKGLVVLGVSVWEKKLEDHIEAVAAMQIPYPQIFDNSQDSQPTRLYGIMGIPQIMLFGPDGTILHRDLRGEQIEEIVKTLY